ncbi:MAG: ComEA family DNA-binding protein [Acutalibacteraceae bacterium]
MKEKNDSLLLVAAALAVSAILILYGIFDSPKYNSFEARLKETSAAFFVSEASTAEPDKIININTADVSELMELEGIGEKKAEDIIEYRLKNGRFRNAEELTEVEGIGITILEKNLGRISV